MRIAPLRSVFCLTITFLDGKVTYKNTSRTLPVIPCQYARLYVPVSLHSEQIPSLRVLSKIVYQNTYQIYLKYYTFYDKFGIIKLTKGERKSQYKEQILYAHITDLIIN